MQRSTATKILAINIHFKILEIIERVGTVTLSCDMEHVKSEGIHSMDVRAVGD